MAVIMQTEDSRVIADRFFAAIQKLKDERVIRGVQTFTRRYGINRRNFITCSRDTSRDIIQLAWLGYLVRDYGVSPAWLLTGEGEFYRRKNKKPATDLQVGKTAPSNKRRTK